MFWVRSVYFNVRNILPKSGTFPRTPCISFFCKAHLHLQYVLKEKGDYFTETLVSICQTAMYHNMKHYSMNHVGSATMQSLFNSSVSSKNGELITPCFPLLPFFNSPTAMVTGFTCVRFVSDVTTGVPVILMATGFSVVTGFPWLQ